MSKNSNFLEKLYDLATSEEYSETCGFNAAGDALVVHDVRTLERDALSKFFNHGNYNSFVRQLNQYGFHKVRETTATEFTHPNFRKGRLDLLKLIERKPSRARARGKAATSAPPPLPGHPSRPPSEAPMSTHEGGAQSYENAPPTQPYGDGFSAGMRGPPQSFSRDDEMDRLIKTNWSLHLEVQSLQARLQRAEQARDWAEDAAVHARHQMTALRGEGHPPLSATGLGPVTTAASFPYYDGAAAASRFAHHDHRGAYLHHPDLSVNAALARSTGPRLTDEEIKEAYEGGGYERNNGHSGSSSASSQVSSSAKEFSGSERAGGDGGEGAFHLQWSESAAAAALPVKRGRHEAFGGRDAPNMPLRYWKELRSRFPENYYEGTPRLDERAMAYERPPATYQTLAGAAMGMPLPDESEEHEKPAQTTGESRSMGSSLALSMMKQKVTSVEMLDFLSNVGV